MLTFDAGTEFDVVAVSFDPKEDAGAGGAEEAGVPRALRAAADGGRLALPDRHARRSITRLADAVGFRYAYDAAIEQYAHAPAIAVLTPEGVVSRYLYGIEFAPRDLRLGAGRGVRRAHRHASIDQVLLLCYHYDPATGKYGAAILNVVRVGGVATVLAFLVVPVRQPAPRARGRPARSCDRTPNLTMFTNFPFFPQQASTQAAQVDALYFFMVAVTRVLLAAHRGARRRLRDQVPPPARRRGRRRRSTARSRSS